MRNIILRVDYHNRDTGYDGAYVVFSDFKKIREFFNKHPNPKLDCVSSKNCFVMHARYDHSNNIPDYEDSIALKEIEKMYQELELLGYWEKKYV